MRDFSELSMRMKAFERQLESRVPSDGQLVARLDGRAFSRLTKETCDFQAPFDDRFHEMMRKTLMALMDCGFHVRYAYSQSDEISLLLDAGNLTYGGRVCKTVSTLAGTASAAFSLQLGKVAVFDCRLLSLPQDEVTDYFLWRYMDAQRNCLNAYAYWTMRNNGVSATDATARLVGAHYDSKVTYLKEVGINYAAVPLWQKIGFASWYRDVEIVGVNALTGESVTSTRQQRVIDHELPGIDEYPQYVLGRIR